MRSNYLDAQIFILKECFECWLVFKCIWHGKPAGRLCYVTIVTLSKKPGTKKWDKNGTVAFTSHFAKVFYMNIFERIAPAFSSRVNNLQHGFMPKTGTIEAIEAIKTAMMYHISKCKGEPLWLTFIDFTKVFDHVDHVKRMEALKNCGVGGKCLRILIWTFTICILVQSDSRPDIRSEKQQM